MDIRTTQHPIITKIFHIILEMQREGKSLTVYWVPAHVDIPQNEKADEGARMVAESNRDVSTDRVIHNDYYPVFRKAIHELGADMARIS